MAGELARRMRFSEAPPPPAHVDQLTFLPDPEGHGVLVTVWVDGKRASSLLPPADARRMAVSLIYAAQESARVAHTGPARGAGT